jgi:4-amino-4-deoxy-L-arabinose transferase-like glycosyltransferase
VKKTRFMEDIREWQIWVFLAMTTLVVRLPLVSVSFERDDASYALMALEMLDGRMPYRDFVSLKPPLLYVLYLPLALIGGTDPPLLRLAGMIYPAASTILLYLLGLALAGRGIALVAAVLFALFSSDPSMQGCIINAETLMLPFTLASALLWWRALRLRSGTSALAGGALLAVAALVKQPAGIQIVLLTLAFMPVRLGGVPASVAARLPLAFIAGMAAVGALVLAGMAAVGLGPYIGEFLNEGYRYVSAPPLSSSYLYFRSLTTIAKTQGAVWILAAIGVAVSGWRPNSRSFFLFWTAGSIAGVLLGRRGAHHYWLQLLPAVCLAAGAGLVFLARNRRPGTVLKALRAGIAVYALFSFVHVLPLLVSSREVKSRSLYPDNNFYEAEGAAAWLKEHAAPGSCVFIAGSEPEIPLLAGLRLAGRYPFVYNLTVDAPGVADARERWLTALDDPCTTSAVFFPNACSWIDIYTSPKTVIELQGRVARKLSGPGWRLAAVVVPYRIYLKTGASGK